MRSIVGAQEERRSTDSIRAAAERSLTICSAIRPKRRTPRQQRHHSQYTASLNTISRTHAEKEKDRLQACAASREHKKSDAAQIASEQQQNAVLHSAQRFAPNAAHPDSNDITVSTLPPSTPSHHARTHAEKEKDRLQACAASRKHKKSDAAQIASEQQQNAVLRAAQRFAPQRHTPRQQRHHSQYTASL
eukprot:COSAG06_NODE_15943_length_1032_cov_1.838330_1_plen_189_part_01